MFERIATKTEKGRAWLAGGLRKIANGISREESEVLGERKNLLAEYVTTMPSAQNAVDSVPGWNMVLPPEAGVTAGTGFYYCDPRIEWAMAQYGSLAGATVLELGPLEASHTYMLHNRGAALIDAVEANRLAFLRCLIVKEVLGLPNAKFHLGDFVPWLENTPKHYDLIVGSGVLYHLGDPLHFIELMSKKTNSLYLWTHYLDDKAMPKNDPRRAVFVGDVETTTFHGIDVHIIQRSYHQAWNNATFCGGLSDNHVWIYRDDLLKVLEVCGFDDIRIAHEEPGHPNGPAFSVYARRSRPMS